MTAEEYQQEISSASREAAQMITRLGCMLLFVIVAVLFLWICLQKKEAITERLTVVIGRLVTDLLWLIVTIGVALAHLFESAQVVGAFLLRRSASRFLLRYRIVRLPVAWLGAFGTLSVGMVVGAFRWAPTDDFPFLTPGRIDEILAHWAGENFSTSEAFRLLWLSYWTGLHRRPVIPLPS